MPAIVLYAKKYDFATHIFRMIKLPATLINPPPTPPGIHTAFKRTAVRETHRGLIGETHNEDPTETPRTSRGTMIPGGLRVTLNWACIMPFLTAYVIKITVCPPSFIYKFIQMNILYHL